MQQNFNEILNNIQFLFPCDNNIDSIISEKSYIPFNDLVCDYLDNVSKRLLQDSEAKTYPDVVTFAFFCRKANIQGIKKSYEGLLNGRLGRGITFHIAPSNVPINFAYSLVSGLLAGNRCIVRASSKDFPQTRIVCRAFNEVAKTDVFNVMQKVFSVIMYNHNSEITSSLSELADIRIIWGGDNTIAEIRKSPLKPRAFDLTFADRYSFAIFDAVYINSCAPEELKKISQNFFNDTYLYDQNACSSPRLIVWLGNNNAVITAKEKFWNAVYENISGKYDLATILSVDKLTAQYKCAVELENAKIEKSCDNLITRITLVKLPKNITEYTCAGGCYLEYQTENLESSQIEKIINPKFQTLSYLGIEAKKIQSFVLEKGLSGIDRIVPVGKTSDFGLVWDGYDLIMTMSRVIYKN